MTKSSEASSSSQTGPYLTTTSPSPTSTLYTISSRQAPPSTLILCLTTLTRLLLITTSLGLLLSTIQTHYNLPIPLPTIPHSYHLLHTLNLPPLITISLSLTTILLALRRPYKQESLLVLRSLGIQTTSHSGWFLLRPRQRFIPTTEIQDIVIQEAFRGFQVVFYLAVIVKGRSELVVVFSGCLPRRDEVERVWRGARKVLWDRASLSSTVEQSTR